MSYKTILYFELSHPEIQWELVNGFWRVYFEETAEIVIGGTWEDTYENIFEINVENYVKKSSKFNFSTVCEAFLLDSDHISEFETFEMFLLWTCIIEETFSKYGANTFVGKSGEIEFFEIKEVTNW